MQPLSPTKGAAQGTTPQLHPRRKAGSTVKLSGNAYLSMTPKDDPTLGRQKIKVFSVKRCAHVETVCDDCVDQWAQDYTVHFSSTAAGRNMVARRTTKAGQS
jgi:hypothetical protein